MPSLAFKDPNVKVPRFGRTRIPSIVKPFSYKIRRAAQLEPSPPIVDVKEEEVLLGFVHGKKASALEERFAKALDEARLQFIFQYPVYSAYSIPGEERQIDFMVFDGPVLIPVEPKGGFIHQSPSRRSEDARRTQVLNEALRRIGIRDIIELKSDEPRDMDSAREIVRSLFVRA